MRDSSGGRCVGVACAATAMLVSIAWASPSWADEPTSGSSPQEVIAVPASPEGSEPSEERSPGRFFTKAYYAEVWQRDYMTGDWGGLRTELNDHGVKPQIKLSQFGQGVASGGRDQKARYGGKVDWILDLDVSKFAGLWPGLFINLHAETQYGESTIVDVGPSALPNTSMIMPLPECGECTNVTNLTIMQGLWEGAIPLQHDKGAAVVAAGKLNIVDLLTMSFPNFGYGLEGFMNFNALFNAWNYLRFWFPAQYGASVALFNEERGMPQLSFLVYGQDNVSTTWDISDSFSDGVGLMGLLRYFWDVDDKMGYAAVLATGSTKKYSFLDGIVWEPPFPGLPPLPGLDVEEGQPWAVNPLIYQEFWRGAGGGKHERKAYVWLSGTVSDESPSFARWGTLATVEALGPFAGRPMDRTGLAGWYTAWNDSYEDELRLVGVSPRDIYGFELYYSGALSPWMHLTADLQIAQNLDKADDIAVIPGVRLVMDF